VVILVVLDGFVDAIDAARGARVDRREGGHGRHEEEHADL